MCQASTCGRLLARARVQALQISGSQMVCQREIFTDKIQEDKNHRERDNVKSARVSALTGSVPRKMAEALQRVSALFRNRTHVARLSATSLNH